MTTLNVFRYLCKQNPEKRSLNYAEFPVEEAKNTALEVTGNNQIRNQGKYNT